MFYRGQFCESDFQNLDHKQCRPPKFPTKFTPLELRAELKCGNLKIIRLFADFDLCISPHTTVCKLASVTLLQH